MEGSPSGLWRTLGKRVGCKPSRVRIPLPPPGEGRLYLYRRFSSCRRNRFEPGQEGSGRQRAARRSLLRDGDCT